MTVRELQQSLEEQCLARLWEGKIQWGDIDPRPEEEEQEEEEQE